MVKKKEELDEMYPDEESKVLTSKKFHTIKEEKPIKSQIKGRLEGAINLLNRNIRNKGRAIEKINEAMELLDKL